MTLDQIVSIFILALVIWRESRGESAIARSGVAHSIMNRVKRPSWWGSDVLSVCTKKWQYSSMTDPHDPQLTTWPASNDPSWQQCLQLADDVISGKATNPVPGADSYYDVSIPAPKWADDKSFVGQLGKIRFYNLDHDIEKEGP